MTRKSAPREAWESLKKVPESKQRFAYVSRARLEKLWQAAYRRGMERAAGVAENAEPPNEVVYLGSWCSGRNAGATRIRKAIANGAKDE